MPDEQINLEVNLTAEAKLDKALGQLEEMSTSMLDIGKRMSQVSRETNTLVKSLSGVSASSSGVRKVADDTHRLAQETDAAARASVRLAEARQRIGTAGRRDTAGNIAGGAGMSDPLADYYFRQQFAKQLSSSVDNAAWIAASKAARETAEFTRLGQLRGEQWTQEVRRLEAAYGQAAGRARMAAAMGAGVGTTPASSAAAVAARFMANPQIANQALLHSLEDMNAVIDVQVEKFDKLTNTRYALMGASFALAATAAGTGLALYGVARAYMDLESAMARVQRTSGLTGQSLGAIENQLINMAQTVPAAFSDIDRIAEMAGQLNVAGEDIGSFTRAAIQFSTATNATADASAEAFGRLNELLPDVQGNFNALGSSILNVGINSVATETDVITTANNIAAVGASAGFTASEVIGFAAAMASLNIRPELARGGLTRIFGQINNVIAAGGVQLDQFAALSGRTADQFAADWRSNAAGVFQDVLKGLNSMTEAGEAANVVLSQIGITNSRDIDVIVRLSQNTDFLAESLGYAAEGFENTGFLAETAAIQFETLESRVQLMLNSFHMLFAEIGSGAAGPFGMIIDGMTGLAIAWQQLNDNAFMHTLFGVVAALTAIVGVTALAAAGFTALTSAYIAAGTAQYHLRKSVIESTQARLAEKVATGAVTAETARNTVATLTNAQSKRAMVGAILDANMALNGHRTRLGAVVGMLGGPWAIAITGAIVGLGAITTEIQKSQASLQVWEDALDSGTAALGAFSAAAQGFDPGRMFGDFDFRQQKDEIAGLIQEIQRIESGPMQFDNMGNLIPAWQRLSNEARIFNDALDEIGANLIKMSPTAATSFITNLADEANLSKREIADLIDMNDDLRNSLIAAADAAGYAVSGTDGLASTTRIASFVLAEMRASTDDASAGLTALEESELSAADAAQYFGDSIAQNFSLPTGMGEAASAMFDLAEGIASGGDSFNYLNQAGQANLAALMQSLTTAMTAGQMMGISSADSVMAVFIALQNAGIDTAQLLASLAQMGVSVIGGVQLSAIGAGMGSATPQVQAFADQLSRVASTGLSAGRATKSAGRGARRAGNAAGSAAREVRTLVDYANDLQDVMSRAFEIRYGGEAAQDKITQGWLDIAEATQDARDAIRDANRAIQESQATMQGLAADRAAKNYFLSIAEAYGDTLRAAKLRAELAEIDAKMADEQDNLADAQRDGRQAQEELSKSLVGNSGTAIQNRETILSMVNSYQDYLQALAASGMSQGELAAKAAELRREFVQQATQAGYSQSEIAKYAESFDDMSIAIDRVPRDITVTANTNPALQALAEFEAKATRAASRAGGGIGGALGGGIAGGIANALDGLIDDLIELLMGQTPETKTGKPDINTGSQIVQPGEIQVWDPENIEYNEAGLQKFGKEAAGSWWDTFTDWLGNGDQVTWWESVGEWLTTPIGQASDEAGTAFGTGLISSIGAPALLTTIAGELADRSKWGNSGTKSGNAMSAALKQEYFSKILPRDFVNRAADGNWNSTGRGSGSKFGEGVKGGYNRSNVPSTLLGPIGRGDWYGRGNSSGSKFGYGVKVGYAKQNPGSSLAKAIRDADWYSAGYKAGSGIETGMKAGFNAKQSRVVAGSGASAVRWFREGGYTGGGGVNDIAGLVHKREYVMPAEATASIGKPALDYMRKHGAMPPTGGGVSLANGITVIAELSPTDRALLAEGNNVTLMVDGQAIARTTNNHNVNSMKRGSN